MKAIYENHYLSDRDVANYARHSFEKLADHFSEEQNNNLIKFLARGMSSGDWEELIKEMLNLGKVDYGAPVGSPMEKANLNKTKELAVYLRSIPEHWVPFAHPHITLRMSAPVPIRTQCFKHKIGMVESESSRRYISSTPELYIPENFRSAAVNVKQGSGNVHPHSDEWRDVYLAKCADALATYEKMILDNVCPEQARFILPQGCEVNWVWTGSLYAYANFFVQRTDSHAQKEVCMLAEAVGEIIQELYPVSWSALTEGNY